MKGKLFIAGAGPGSVDLVTVGCKKALEKADLVIYAGSLVNPEILAYCPKRCKKVDSAKLSLPEVVEYVRKYTIDGKIVVRLHTGDPAMYGAISEQMNSYDELGIEYEVIPGVSSIFAAAAALKCELTMPGITQTLILTRTPGRTPMPKNESVANFAKTGATLAFFLSVGKVKNLTNELIKEGYTPDTSAAIVYRASWPNQKIVRGTLSDIAEKGEEQGIKRQALILVGNALKRNGEKSLLYDANFSHGYRNKMENEMFSGKCALYAMSEKGVNKAVEIASGLGDATVFIPEHFDNGNELCKTYPSGEFDRILKENWNTFKGQIFVCATGIAVRKIAPLLTSKTEDPAVLVSGEAGDKIISLVGGHIGGANRLARRVARITGGEALITTATDTEKYVAFDELAARKGWDILDCKTIKHLNAALLTTKTVDLLLPKEIYSSYYQEKKNLRQVSTMEEISSEFAVLLDPPEDVVVPEDSHWMILRSPEYVLGVGCRKGVQVEDLDVALHDFLGKNNVNPDNIQGFASVDIKFEEQGLLQLSEKHGKPIKFYSSEDLEKIEVPTPSEMVKEKIGIGSVSEAAAIKGTDGGHITYPKAKYGNLTFALAKKVKKQKKAGRMLVIGLGSGTEEMMTGQAKNALDQCDVIAGYIRYVDFIRDQIGNRPIIENGMRGEIERCQKAMEAAEKGQTVGMVCSGDPGVLAMAGLMFQLKDKHENFKEIDIQVIPGITAASLAASVLGAPLQNGYHLISLSDLLIPSEEVVHNMETASKSHLPCVFYNPAGKKRRELLHKTIDVFKENRGGKILCAYVKHAGRPKQEKWIGMLNELNPDDIDMSTLFMIGGDRTVLENGIFYEKRGYEKKMD